MPLALVLGCALGRPPYDRLVIDTFMPTGFFQNDTFLTLIDSAGNLIAQDDNSNPDQVNHQFCSRIDYQNGLLSGTYYIKVHKPTDVGSLQYCIRVLESIESFPATAPVNEAPDTDGVVDGNGVPIAPVAITLGQVISRAINPEPPDPAADVDWFKLVLP